MNTLTVISHRVFRSGYHKNRQVLGNLFQILLLLQSADQFKQSLKAVHGKGKSAQFVCDIAVHILRIPAEPVTGSSGRINSFVIASEGSLINKMADMLRTAEQLLYSRHGF